MLLAKDNRYKDRDPKETVAVIKRFFKELSPDFEIKEISYLGDNIGVYSVHIHLLYKGNLIGRANGKGMTKEFSLASGYAELYERFANETYLDARVVPFAPSKLRVPVDFEEELKLHPQIKGIDDDVRRFLTADQPNEHTGYLYKSLFDDKTVAIDPNLALAFVGTNGMAAGNTITEALNQGLSELVERYVLGLCFFNKVKLTKISDKLLQKKAPETYAAIQRIKEQGFDVTYYDAANATGFPVIFSLWVNKDMGLHATRVGAFPIFKIAAERCLTETLQGRDIRAFNEYLDVAPFTEASTQKWYQLTNNGKEFLPEEIFDTVLEEDEYNQDIYAKEDATNEELLDHYKYLLSDLHKMDVYWNNTSLTKEMAAVHIHSPQLDSVFPATSLTATKEDVENALDLLYLSKKESYSYKDLNEIISWQSNHTEDIILKTWSTETKVRNALPQYMQFIAHYALKEYQTAADILSRCYEESYLLLEERQLSLFRAIVNYKMNFEDITDLELIHKLKIFGYEADEIKPLLETGPDFLKKFLSEYIWGENYEKIKERNRELRRLLDKARKEALSDE